MLGQETGLRIFQTKKQCVQWNTKKFVDVDQLNAIFKRVGLKSWLA